MKTLVGGAAAAILGLIGLVVWFKPFMQLLAGAIPAMLLLGGGLAIYLGFDELKDTWKKDDSVGSPVGKGKHWYRSWLGVFTVKFGMRNSRS